MNNHNINMPSRNEYLKKIIRPLYLKTESSDNKKEKSKLLDEAEKVTGLNRKYLIEKLKSKSNLDKLSTERKKRKQKYGNEIKPALKRCWEIFDKPCGQRLKTLLGDEVSKLRESKELVCSDDIAFKLQEMSTKTIDIKLKSIKENERSKRKYGYGIHPLLYQKIPVKVFGEQDRKKSGFTQIDFVEHCGRSPSGEYLYSQSTADNAHGWWEGEPQMGRSQERTLDGLKECRKRSPILWTEIHPDNDSSLLNWHLLGYTEQENLHFSRSRPYKKNDNCLIEQKNASHIRKHVGHLRFDTKEELKILRSLYRNELRLYKNFFQPQIKLISKVRIKGKIHRKYDKAKTPYKRIMEDPNISEETKQKLTRIYDSLNPAELKRAIDKKLDALYKAYKKKNSSRKVEGNKKLKPNSVRFSTTDSDPISVR